MSAHQALMRRRLVARKEKQRLHAEEAAVQKTATALGLDPNTIAFRNLEKHVKQRLTTRLALSCIRPSRFDVLEEMALQPSDLVMDFKIRGKKEERLRAMQKPLTMIKVIHAFQLPQKVDGGRDGATDERHETADVKQVTLEEKPGATTKGAAWKNAAGFRDKEKATKATDDVSSKTNDDATGEHDQRPAQQMIDDIIHNVALRLAAMKEEQERRDNKPSQGNNATPEPNDAQGQNDTRGQNDTQNQNDTQEQNDIQGQNDIQEPIATHMADKTMHTPIRENKRLSQRSLKKSKNDLEQVAAMCKFFRMVLDFI